MKSIKINPNNYWCKYCGEPSILHMLMAMSSRPKEALKCRTSPTRKHQYEYRLIKEKEIKKK